MCHSSFFLFGKKFKIELLESLGEEKSIIVSFGKDSSILTSVRTADAATVCKESV